MIVATGGELLAAFEKEGEDGVLKFANEKLISMMYGDGTSPQMIRFTDYAKWKKTTVRFSFSGYFSTISTFFSFFFLRINRFKSSALFEISFKYCMLWMVVSLQIPSDSGFLRKH